MALAPPTIGTARPSGDQGMASGRCGGRWSCGSAPDPGARLIGSGSAVYLPIDLAQAEAGTGGELQVAGGLARQQPRQARQGCCGRGSPRVRGIALVIGGAGGAAATKAGQGRCFAALAPAQRGKVGSRAG
jgi:hypothetical protein